MEISLATPRDSLMLQVVVTPYNANNCHCDEDEFTED